ncbi:STAS/SEC14 domain-containing protein [Kocuria sp. SM24M-10]|jgi:hypothetical protein|uniref:STAS/SEC14 domain-containing protein n=1 Tax=Kocuria TaxID=57493 RepID=UPI00064A0AC6|nr:STAS/SEC14 domain-containing protein [Kocuria sp. SM24M-10]KLU09343.1 hypothetical protein ABL57_12890 [Kocuria sp. SM24M-10]
MLETTVQSGTNIVTITADGGVTAEDMQRMRAVLDEVVREHDSVRMVAVRGDIDFADISPRALWLDLKSAGYLKKLERLAVVTDVDWEAKLSEWTTDLLHVPTRRFRLDERTAALAWISQP